MTRHEGFIAFSPADVAAYFNEQNIEALNALYGHVVSSRAADGKSTLQPVLVVYTDNPVAENVRALLEGQIQREVADFYQPVTAHDLLTIIESGGLGMKSNYFDGYTTEDVEEMIHYTPTGTVWSPATNMVQAFSLAEQFGVMVGNVLAEKPVSVVVKGELEAYPLPSGDEENYSNRLNETILFAVRRVLQANHKIDFAPAV